MSENQQDEQQQIVQRRAKLSALRENGIAFPTDFRRNVISGELLAEYGEKTKEELEE
ncbi:MAG: lysine--tRNA ligase, partial [Methylomarinum sp.]|nr:lysine--tRNA ligase [Methylomarinum sp.]